VCDDDDDDFCHFFLSIVHAHSQLEIEATMRYDFAYGAEPLRQGINTHTHTCVVHLAYTHTHARWSSANIFIMFHIYQTLLLFTHTHTHTHSHFNVHTTHAKPGIADIVTRTISPEGGALALGADDVVATAGANAALSLLLR
jgi:hypothetical protein